MPVYNGDKYLAIAIESILNQSYKNFEFIIINDGSTDSSEKIILSYNDNRILYIKNETNLGLIKSLNKGIELAKGNYIARMDADDISLPNRLMHQHEFMENNSAVGVCGCNYFQFSGSHKKYQKAFILHDEIFANMLFNSSVIHPSLFIRRNILNNFNQVFDNKFKHAEDYELWSRLIFISKFSSVNSTDFMYRLHKNQVTKVHSSEQIINANLVRKSILQKSGFVFSEDELQTHCIIGSSKLITSINELQRIELWLKSLLNQNKKLKLIDEKMFQTVIGKNWVDSCGNTNIGIKAYFFYNKSDLKKLYPSSRLKLIVKCIIRRFKK
jgi:glycosyltransferase involved in cell wall biosynthesis